MLCDTTKTLVLRNGSTGCINRPNQIQFILIDNIPLCFNTHHKTNSLLRQNPTIVHDNGNLL